MTLHSRIWAIGTLALFLPLGAVVMMGIIPGADSDFKAVRGFAISTHYLVEQHGAVFTGSFYMLIGVVLSAVFFVWGDYLRRSDGNSGGDLWDCGDGGD